MSEQNFEMDRIRERLTRLDQTVESRLAPIFRGDDWPEWGDVDAMCIWGAVKEMRDELIRLVQAGHGHTVLVSDLCKKYYVPIPSTKSLVLKQK